MKLPRHIVAKSRLLGKFPWLGRGTANSIGPLILIPQHIYKDLESDSPAPHHVALLIHEETHRRRQKELGYLKFGVQYLFNAKFRFNEELLAVKEAMKFLKKNNIVFEFDRNATVLSSYLYLWPVSKEYAESQLKKIWDEI